MSEIVKDKNNITISHKAGFVDSLETVLNPAVYSLTPVVMGSVTVGMFTDNPVFGFLTFFGYYIALFVGLFPFSAMKEVKDAMANDGLCFKHISRSAFFKETTLAEFLTNAPNLNENSNKLCTPAIRNRSASSTYNCKTSIKFGFRGFDVVQELTPTPQNLWDRSFETATSIYAKTNRKR